MQAIPWKSSTRTNEIFLLQSNASCGDVSSVALKIPHSANHDYRDPKDWKLAMCLTTCRQWHWRWRAMRSGRPKHSLETGSCHKFNSSSFLTSRTPMECCCAGFEKTVSGENPACFWKRCQPFCNLLLHNKPYFCDDQVFYGAATLGREGS